jgi:hypothetical protein
MAISIRNPEAEQLAEELAKQTGETKTDAVIKALRDRLAWFVESAPGTVRLMSSKKSLFIVRGCPSLTVDPLTRSSVTTRRAFRSNSN